MNRRPQRDEPNRVHVRDGESEKSSGKAPIEEEKKRRKRMREKRRYPRGREGTDATVSRIREKRWKEDVREKTEVKTIGQ